MISPMDPLAPATPARNATVMASAGTGKTWLLVTRLIRLLLAGARPEGIVAITFTRKAAAEMQHRLSQRLLEMAIADDQRLDELLQQQGISAGSDVREQARALYETLLHTPQGIRTTTFHAFCQEILRRFPLEAEVPAGFELLESSGVMEQEAWDALFSEATRHPESPLAEALENLFLHCNGLFNTRSALLEFLGHRSDWWAFTDGQEDPVAHAAETLRSQLPLDADGDPVARFFSSERLKALREYAELLSLHETKTNLSQRDLLCHALECRPLESAFEKLTEVFLTKALEPRALRPSKQRTKAMGEPGESRFFELHETLCQAILEVLDQQAAQRTLQLSEAWFLAGHRLVEHYQRIKEEQRLLDFSDLEWRAYKLLSTTGNALWVQYKLDQRIDHLLIDEFQDTNPTQWRLILPLLEEMAAGRTADRPRSVFLVGDGKQSIYRFRRAEPRLFDAARDWLDEHLDAGCYPMDRSWRSAPAIMHFVNRLFGSGELNRALPHFHPHETHRRDLWGKVELLPLIEPEQEPARERNTLRNPLQEPRESAADWRHYREGEQIATAIRTLVESRTPIEDGGKIRPLNHGDILVLIARRTHLPAIEQALRAAEIPYLGANRGTLLESQEVKDMEALLDILGTPHNNLSLAVVLRSPLFACTDADLNTLATQSGGSWWERLQSVSVPEETPLAKARRWLTRWRELAARLPVHDLLQCIFSEGNVLARYEAAFPRHLRQGARANLQRFLQLALEVDSGRYPSLMRFLLRLQELRELQQDAPDEAPGHSNEPQVRLMTIHAAKGLEAPVVFLVDSADGGRRNRGWSALVRWPPDAERPSHFLLTGKRKEADPLTRSLLEKQAEEERREEANLLYVAVTRARQLLYISGCAPARGEDYGWYGIIQKQFEEAAGGKGGILISSGTPPEIPSREAVAPSAEVPSPDARLRRPLTIVPSSTEIAPSRQVGHPQQAGDPDGRLRGIIIHRMLELLSRDPGTERTALLQQVAGELELEPETPLLPECYQEARGVIEAPALRPLFDEGRYLCTYNEVPLLYDRNGQTVHGIIDRLLVEEKEVTLIDYKTHQNATPETIPRLAEEYRPQMELYAEGVRRLWPGRSLRALLLFTASRTLHEFSGIPPADR